MFLSPVTAAINIEPPTPTTTAGNEPSLVGDGGSRDVPSEDGVDRLTTTDSLKSCDDEMLPSTTSGRHGDGDGEGKGAGTARGKSPCFSPASLQNSPGNSNLVRKKRREGGERNGFPSPHRWMTGCSDWRGV